MTQCKYAIIGAGYSGTVLFWHWVNALIDNSIPRDNQVHIITVEKSDVNGPGYPYKQEELLSCHLCNNPAGNMSVHGNDFVVWMHENRQHLLTEHLHLLKEPHPNIEPSSWQPDPLAFYPRELFGIYLEAKFRETVRHAEKNGIQVTNLNNCEVIGGQENKNHFQLTVKSQHSKKIITIDHLNKVFLGTGHWQRKKTTTYDNHTHCVLPPYPAWRIKQQLKSITKQSPSVYVQGMGPSGVDAIVGVHQLCRSANLIASSRCGFFPGVRSPKLELNYKYLTSETLNSICMESDGKLSLGNILNLVNDELLEQSNGEICWDDIQTPPYKNAYEKLVDDTSNSRLNMLTQAIILKARRLGFYNKLSALDKRAYDRDYDRHFIRTAVPIPKSNASKLIKLFESEQLKTVSLNHNLSESAKTSCPSPDTTLSEKQLLSSHPADIIIHARGQSYSIDDNPSLLFKNLIQQGFIAPNQEQMYTTGGLAANQRYNLMTKNNAISHFLSSFGPPIRYWQNEHNFSRAFVEAAEIVSQDWLKELLLLTDSKNRKLYGI